MSDNTAQKLPPGWTATELGEITCPSRPRHHPRDHPNLPFIGMEHVEAHTMRLLATVPAHTMKSSAVYFWPGDVLYGRLRPYLNKVYRPEFEGLCSAEFIVFPHSTYLDPRYLQCLLNSSTFVSFASHLNTGDRPRVDYEQLSPYPVNLAPLCEQHRIADEIEKQFTRLDAAVAALERVRANLRRYRAAVLATACEGRLVPTEAELARAEGREYEPADVLLKRILQERRRRWEADQPAKISAVGKAPKDDGWQARYQEPAAPDTSNISALPEGWAWATAAQLGHIQGGIQKQPKRAPQKNAFPFLRVANVLRGRLDLADVHKVELFGGELEKLRLAAGDLLIVEGNGSPSEIGRMAIWSGAIGDCVHQNHIIRIRPVLGIRSQYVESYWNSLAGSDSVLRVAGSTSGLYTLSVSKVGKLLVPLPPVAEQDRILAEVERRLSVIEKLEATVSEGLKRADRLRQSILRHAFEGKLVPQDSADEPASVLLEQIRAERAQTAVTSRTARGRRRRVAAASRSPFEVTT